MKEQLANPKTKSWQEVKWEDNDSKKIYTTTIGTIFVEVAAAYPGVYNFQLYSEPKHKAFLGLKFGKRDPSFSGFTFGLRPAKFLAVIRADITYLNSNDFDRVFEEFLNQIDYEYINPDVIDDNGFSGFIDLEKEWGKVENPMEDTIEEIQAVNGSVFVFDKAKYRWEKQNK